MALTEEPTVPFYKQEGFLIFAEWGVGYKWVPMMRAYSALWTALKYGCPYYNIAHYILDLSKNKIVWKSWEDENKYRGSNG